MKTSGIQRAHTVVAFAVMLSLLLACSRLPPTATSKATAAAEPTGTFLSTGTPSSTPTSKPTDKPVTPTNTLLPTQTVAPSRTPAIAAISPPLSTHTASFTPTSWGTTETPIPRDALVILNGTIIDGTGNSPISDGLVAIQGERIVVVGRAADFSIPPEATVFDAAGGTIMPGFINAHVHDGYNEHNLEAWAQGGVTTVRDLFNSSPPDELFAFRDEVRDQPQYARLVAAGPMVTVPKGYPMIPFGSEGLTVTSPDDARQKVEQLMNDGADVIKIALESGAIVGQALPMLSPEDASTIVQVAHGRGVPVTAHVTVSQDLEKALDAGVDDIDHMITDNLTDELVDRMVETGVYWVPTLELWRHVSNRNPVSFDKQAIANLRRFVAAGGKAALGTDYAGYAAQFELGMPTLEIELMQEAGMTPMQIIIAATRDAAHLCNLGHEIGTLEPGKIADVLVVDGDPLEDIHALARTNLVLRDGVVIRQ